MDTATTAEDTTQLLLSVIIPTHNVEAWISETLLSVLAQDVASMEVIVVDDHSTDRTVEIVQSVAARDSRVTLVPTASRGGGSARNAGVALAKGRYIVFADGDDLIPENAYAALVGSLERTGSQIAVGDYLKFSPTKTWRPTASMSAFDQPAVGVRLTQIPTLIYSRPCWNKAFDLAFWRDNGILFPDVPRSNDIEPMIVAYTAADRIDVIEDVVYLYRDRPGMSSMSAKTASATAFLSYLTQELRCAERLEQLQDSSVRSVYASLIYDRDGFFHARKFLSAWAGESETDAEVSVALGTLLGRTGPASERVDARKRMALALLADREFLAARAVAQTVDGGVWSEQDTLLQLRSWVSLLQTAARDWTRWSEFSALIERGALRVLQNVRLTSDAEELEWTRLAQALAERPGSAFVGEIPESADPRAGAKLRRQTGATVTAIFGGEPLRFRGHSHGTEAMPVLWAAEVGVIKPRRHEWRDGDQGVIWEAEFRVGDLPRGHVMQPAFVDRSGRVASVFSEGQAPEYRRLENVLYEQDGGWVRLERRRHWIIRAPRRLLIMLRDRVHS